ncbi:hypothetical protein AMS68_003189 [Peltaster fructicola]|uniref:BZIP domain-containing protein n=1 Tax=Peltaster fructicola TaxID=286661 RepID=A0A6H0XSD0_9PEZI|nr:hypothetical protein AMS68_003189 [Peltaster fructicola]
MGAPLGDLSIWGDGANTAVAQDIGNIQLTAVEIDELASIFDSAQASSANTSPSLAAYPSDDTPPPLHASVSQIVSSAVSPETSSTPPQPLDPERKRKRDRNTEAARRYRKRRVDETDELREALAAMTKERDALRLQLVKAETERDLFKKLASESKSKP